MTSPKADLNTLNEAIIQGINHPLVMLNEEFSIVRYNQRFLDIFRLAPESAEGAHITEALGDPRIEIIVRQSMASSELIREVEYTTYAGDGEERNFLLSISRIDLPGAEGSVLLTFDEVTEWKRRQYQVMEASRLVSIGEMAAGIAHEINNPLAAVMGFTQLVMRRQSEPSVHRDLEKILAEAKRASKIINNLQSFARRYKPKKVNVNVLDVLQKVLEFRAYELEVSNIQVVKNFEPDLPQVLGDEHQLEQVFLNLVINAEYFMSEANGGGTLTVRAFRRGAKVVLSFADDGPGIAKENLSKIFDPFFTTKEVGKGTGLGLSICYGIVHEHNGTIRVESTPGQGATFVIELPAAQVSESSDGHSPASARRQTVRVLIVDDEESIGEFASRALRDAGYHVDVASGGAEAIRNRDLASYDVLVLDVKMPGIGGVALYEYIKRQSQELASRVLFITGDTTSPSTRAFIDQTGSPLLTKPFTLEDLMTAVRRLASKRGAKV